MINKKNNNEEYFRKSHIAGYSALVFYHGHELQQ
jgi:hypothetical protein